MPSSVANLTTLASFNGGNGYLPYAGVTPDAAGDLFGTVDLGGANNLGAVFEIAAGTSSITMLASFAGANGSNPYGGVIVDAAGNLYGTTRNGGANGQGTAFEIAAGTGSVTTLATFIGSNGANPTASLSLDAAGDLFGTTSRGGANNQGAVFEIAAGSTGIAHVWSFNFTDGASPASSVIVDAAGDLFGTTLYGGATSNYYLGNGTVFEIAAGSSSITTLAKFAGSNGANPQANLTQDASGNLFGTTADGGANNGGTIFEIAAGTTSIITLASFSAASGAGPQGGVLLDVVGNLFGTTNFNGPNGKGTVFELVAGTNSVTTLASFSGADGSYPRSGLVQIGGNLFGTALLGGVSGDGAVFEVTNSGYATVSPLTVPTAPTIVQETVAGYAPTGALTITGSAAKGSTVTIYDGNTELGTTVADSGTGVYSLTLNPPLGNGPHSIDVTATLYGQTTAASLATPVIVDTHNPLATIGLVNDTSGGSLVTSNDALTGTADNNATIQLSIDGGAAVGVVAGNSGGWGYNPVGLTNGAHTVSITDTDLAGKSTTASITFTYDSHTPDAPAITGVCDVVSTAISGNAVVAVRAGDNVTIFGTMDEKDGTVSLLSGGTVVGTGSVQTDGTFSIAVTAPASGSKTFSAEFTDTANAVSALSNSITLVDDAGPSVASGSFTIGHNQSRDITALIAGLITNGHAGDIETIASTTGNLVKNAQGHWIYTAPNGGGVDTIGFTVTNQLGETQSGSIAVNVDLGPVAGTGAYLAGHGKTSDVTALVASLVGKGMPSDTETIVAVTGNAVLNANNTISYTAPNDGSTSDHFSYTVQDQFGDTSTGVVNVTVDQGPHATPGALHLPAGDVLDLTSYLAGLVTPGVAGDVETITSNSADLVKNAQGALIYTAPASGASDSISFTVTDQFGQTATDSVAVSLGHTNTVVYLQGYGNSVYGPAGVAVSTGVVGPNVYGPAAGWWNFVGSPNDLTITAYGYSNTINAGGGNDTIYAGLSGAKVSVSDVNGNNTVLGLAAGAEGNSYITLGDGNNDVELAGYNNRITLGNGDNTVKAGLGGEIVHVGNGNNTIQADGTADTIFVGAGSNTVALSGSSNSVTVAGGTAHITATGYYENFTINGGNATIGGLLGLASIALGTGFGAGSSLDLTGISGILINAGGTWEVLKSDYEVFATFALPAGVALQSVSDGHGGMLITTGIGAPPVVSTTITETQGFQNVTLVSPTTTLHLWGYYNHVSSASGGFTITGDQGFSIFNLAGDGNTLALAGYGDTVEIGVDSLGHSIATGNNTVGGTSGNTTVMIGNGNQTIVLGGNYNYIATGVGNSTINAGWGFNTVTVAGGNNTIATTGNSNLINTGTGADTVTLGSGWYNSIHAGSGVTTVTGGYGNTYVAGSGEIKVTDFNAAFGDVLDLRSLESAMGVTSLAFTVVSDVVDPLALDFYVTDPHSATTLVASLHGAHGSLASLIGAHTVLT